jgi:hypothetical protein
MLKLISWDAQVSYYRPVIHQNMGALHGSIPLMCHPMSLWTHSLTTPRCFKHLQTLVCNCPPQHTLWLLLMWPPKFGRTHKKPCARSSLQEYGWVVRLVTLFGIRSLRFQSCPWKEQRTKSGVLVGLCLQIWQEAFQLVFVNLEYH